MKKKFKYIILEQQEIIKPNKYFYTSGNNNNYSKVIYSNLKKNENT